MVSHTNAMIGMIVATSIAVATVGFSSPLTHRRFFGVGTPASERVLTFASNGNSDVDVDDVQNVLFDSVDDDASSSSNDDFDDDPNAIDPDTLGIYTEADYDCRFGNEWDPSAGDPDPNDLDPDLEYVTAAAVDEEGVEIGWDPVLGPSNPIDTRTIVTAIDSYVIAERTRNESMVAPTFVDDDPDTNPEVVMNDRVATVRRNMKRIETYHDEHLGDDVLVPKNVATWYGYPETTKFPERDFSNNRFTRPEDKTDFTELSPYRARKKAVEMARSYNTEWLPYGVTEELHRKRRQIYVDRGIKVGSLEPGNVDPVIAEQIRPCLKVLGSCAELLEIYGENNAVFRFKYNGAMKNRKGMAAWTETMIRDCGAKCTGVVFETGGRRRDEGDD